MSSCKEFYIVEVSAITAIPLSAFSDASVSLMPTIPDGSFTPVKTDAIVIGSLPNAEGTVVGMMTGTGKASDKETDAVAGRLHAVEVSCDLDYRDDDVWEILLELERIPHHLILSLRDGRQAFISGSEDSYHCSRSHSADSVSVEFRLYNLMGMQMIV